MKGMRTILLNVALLAILLTDYLMGAGSLFSSVFTDPKDAALAVMGVNALNIALRFITTGPVKLGKTGGKDEPDAR